MYEITFIDKIRKELKYLNSKQIVYFAWLCAVYSLPFLGSHGHFNFWNRNSRQKYLFFIFYALDISAFSTFTYKKKFVNHASEACDSVEADTDARNVSSAVDFAADTAAHTRDSSLFAVNEVRNTAINAAINSFYAANRNNKDLKIRILHDLNKIRDREEINPINTKHFYGVIWDNFQKALAAEGCSFWGRLYQSIFDNGFKINQKALIKRMNVPKEIQEQGASAVANYLEALENEGEQRLNEARIIILGDKGAGKTCLARKLTDPKASMTTDAESTAGVDTTLWKLKKENINIHIWDFAGHTVTHAVHQFFLSERCLYIIVYDGRTEERNRLEYWLNHIKNFGGDSKAIILVNQRDQHSIDIPINSLKEKYLIEDYCTFSIKDDNIALEKFHNNVTEFINNNPSWNNQVIPVNYFKVKEELEELFVNRKQEKGTEYITLEDFINITGKHKSDKNEELLKNLHALGICLWYPGMDRFKTLVLNPEWISHGVYKIINWVNEAKRYSLSLNDFITVFTDDAERYPVDKHEFIYELMMHYELAYETDGKDKCLIIPHLLKEDQPASLPVFQIGDSLMLRYKAEQPLPPNTISRFIVRHNREIKKDRNKNLVWRYGVILEDGKGNIALVREEDRTISVSVKGPGKTEYISTLRETLNDIFNSYKSNKPELQYRVERFGQILDEVEKQNPLWLPDSKILTHTQENIPYFDDKTRQQIDLHYTVNYYNITAQTLISGQGNEYFDNSIHNTFNFQECNINLQGNLNELARLIAKKGNVKDSEELKDAAAVLEEVEKCTSKEDVKKKGLLHSLQSIMEKLGDEDSSLHKTVAGLEKGISIAQDIAQKYNDIAQWVGWPQVPRPFLKKQE
ncbi:MAG TPA: COR domain-containing protein [bacterium]|nr:COR domain-containing protein [bacterium]HPN46083.1 COR domain-containing protein [bacterium]